MNPYKHLDLFEQKNGEYNFLLGQYSNAISRCPEGQTSEESRKYDALLRMHKTLVERCVGYTFGYEDGLKVKVYYSSVGCKK
jgi:hypothetical protein